MNRRSLCLAAIAPLASLAAAFGEPRQGEFAPFQPGERLVGLSMQAVFAGSNKIVTTGLEWRVFPDTEREDRRPHALSWEAQPTFQVPPGAYLVHVTYGLAFNIGRVTVGPSGNAERITISAGGLILKGAIGDQPLPDDQLAFTVFAPLNNRPEGKMIVQNVRGGELVRVPEGTYHVVSTYGGINAVRRADIKVDSGVVISATLNHRAARVVLKLVLRRGGEALAGTAFTVLTPGGDSIHEAIGAFPSVVLAEGEYVLVARNGGKVYTHQFKVESGRNTDIEALAE